MSEYAPALPPTKCRHASGRISVASARAERLISTAVLGFAASEASGRFRQHDQSVIDADFAELLRWFRLVLGPARPPGRY